MKKSSKVSSGRQTADKTSTITTTTTNTSRTRWQKALKVLKVTKQFQKVRFVVDPQMHENIDECPVEKEESTVDESQIYYTDAKTAEQKSFCSKERLTTFFFI